MFLLRLNCPRFQHPPLSNYPNNRTGSAGGMGGGLPTRLPLRHRRLDDGGRGIFCYDGIARGDSPAAPVGDAGSIRLRRFIRTRSEPKGAVVMTNQDRDYFRRREHEERAQAARTDDCCARLIHLQLADRYQARHRAMGQLAPRLV